MLFLFTRHDHLDSFPVAVHSVTSDRFATVGDEVGRVFFGVDLFQSVFGRRGVDLEF